MRSPTRRKNTLTRMNWRHPELNRRSRVSNRDPGHPLEFRGKSMLVPDGRVAGLGFVRLFALRVAAGSPQDADKERRNNHRDDEERGRDAHVPRVSKPRIAIVIQPRPGRAWT